jgi:hypothetical protein
MKLFELRVRGNLPAGILRTMVVHAKDVRSARMICKKETGRKEWIDPRLVSVYEVGDFACVVEKIHSS